MTAHSRSSTLTITQTELKEHLQIPISNHKLNRVILTNITVLGGSNAGDCNRCYRSVVCLSVRLSHSCTLLKPLDGMKCHSSGPK